MLKRIQTFLQERKTSKQLKKVLSLLYSETKYEAAELVDSLLPKSDIEKIEFYVVVEVATKLEQPFNGDDIARIWEEQIKALEYYLVSKESRSTALELVKTKAELSILNFNAYMNTLKKAHEFNFNSPGGVLYRELISKRRPLTKEEYEKINK